MDPSMHLSENASRIAARHFRRLLGAVLQEWVWISHLLREVRWAANSVRLLSRRKIVLLHFAVWSQLTLHRRHVGAVGRRMMRRMNAMLFRHTLSLWRNWIFKTVYWRTKVPALRLRWNWMALRNSLLGWHHTVERMRILHQLVCGMTRRRNATILMEGLCSWGELANRKAVLRKVSLQSSKRLTLVALREAYQHWDYLVSIKSKLKHTVAVLVRRRAVNVLVEILSKWSEWSSSCSQQRRVISRALQGMRNAFVAADISHELWRNMCVARLQAQNLKLQGEAGHGRIVTTLSRTINRIIARILRAVIRDWSLFVQRRRRLCKACLRTQRRSIARLLSQAFGSWLRALDMRIHLANVHERICRRRVLSLKQGALSHWKDLWERVSNFRGRLRKLRRRMQTRIYLRNLLLLQAYADESLAWRLERTRSIRRNQTDFLGA
mmetsp:Transcript_5865/g.9290  ORF Transcript_5865/g.9290 Transcript_5865/m.9290 type:complete len:438 (+) Transcript_5865:124-1437(+)